MADSNAILHFDAMYVFELGFFNNRIDLKLSSLFDMDGTLVNSTAGVIGAWEVFRQSYPDIDVNYILSCEQKKKRLRRPMNSPSFSHSIAWHSYNR